MGVKKEAPGRVTRVAVAAKQVANARGWRSKRNAEWIETHCKVPEGRHVGKDVKLTKEQRQWLVDIYDSPTRVFILSMGRKNGKTAFAAFLLLLHLCGPEAFANSTLYSAAQSREQAAILFTLAMKMVLRSPSLSAFVGIRDTAKQLYCPELGTLYRALSAEASTSFGLSPVFVVHDELGQVRGPRSELYEALETACAAQENPLSIIISTQAPTDADLLSMLIDDALTGADPMTKCRLYTADIDAEPFAEATIRQANPHFDTLMNVQEVLRQAKNAERLPSRESAYRNLILNQRVDAKNPLISRSVWMDNAVKPASPIGRKVWGGLDLSSVADLTALVWVDEDNGIHPTFWLPEEGIEEKSKEDRVPYDVWADEGHLELTPGRTVDYAYVAHWLREVFDKLDVQKLAFDRYNMKFLKPRLIEAGFTEEEIAEKFVEFGQGYQSMSPAIRELEARLASRRMKHGAQPVLTMCCANAVAMQDPAGNRKFIKAKATGRIDGMVSLAMAVGVMPEEVEGSLDDFLQSLKATHGVNHEPEDSAAAY